MFCLPLLDFSSLPLLSLTRSLHKQLLRTSAPLLSSVVWRTAPFVGKSQYYVETNNKIRWINEKVRKYFPSQTSSPSLRLLDLEAIMSTKSRGDDRVGVHGDTSEHFDGDARMAFLQSLVGVVEEES